MENTDHQGDENPQSETPDIDQRPSHIPEKFWDSETGSLRSDMLIKSYGELEKRFAGENYDENNTDIEPVPQIAEDYKISVDTDMFESDPALNERLHAAGFNNDQAQLVYDLALEHLIPIAEQLSHTLDHKAQTDRLETYFGGRKQWADMERQLQNWGRSNLSLEAFESMSSNFNGVLSMHRMMAKNEPAIMAGHNPSSSLHTESELKSMMKDPRYWRDQNPAYVEQIRQGFEALYSS